MLNNLRLKKNFKLRALYKHAITPTWVVDLFSLIIFVVSLVFTFIVLAKHIMFLSIEIYFVSAKYYVSKGVDRVVL